jgi:hypothetical protein
MKPFGTSAVALLIMRMCISLHINAGRLLVSVASVDDITSQHEDIVQVSESIQTGPEEHVKLSVIRDCKCMKMLCACYPPLFLT